MPQLFTNGARALLASSINASATAITIESGKADLFPTANVGASSVPSPNNWFKATLEDAAGNLEIVYVRTRTAGSGLLNNVLRGQEGTTARSYAVGAVIGLRLTAVDVEVSIGAAASAVLTTGTQTVGGVKTFVDTIVGSVTGNAGTVTDGLYSTGTYADPLWLTTLDAGKLTSGTVPAARLSGTYAITATNVTGVVAIANGGTGFNTAVGARANLGLGTLAVQSPGGANNSSTFLRGDNVWAGIPAPSTEQVLSLTAAANVGDVGTYAFLVGGSAVGPGTLRGAGELFYANTEPLAYATSPRPAGTWRCMGQSGTGFFNDGSGEANGSFTAPTPTLWLRIS